MTRAKKESKNWLDQKDKEKFGLFFISQYYSDTDIRRNNSANFFNAFVEEHDSFEKADLPLGCLGRKEDSLVITTCIDYFDM